MKSQTNQAEQAYTILRGVEDRYGVRFDPEAESELLFHSAAKCAVNGKGLDYFPILLENEAEDYIMRQQINERYEKETRYEHPGIQRAAV